MEIVKKIREIAIKHEWVEIDNQENIMMISFTRNQERINVYYSRPHRMTVATVLNHPRYGRKQLFRKYIKMYELEKIFNYPRAHTCKGYFTKK
jgi:hypothetical protein